MATCSAANGRNRRSAAVRRAGGDWQLYLRLVLCRVMAMTIGSSCLIMWSPVKCIALVRSGDICRAGSGQHRHLQLVSFQGIAITIGSSSLIMWSTMARIAIVPLLS